MLNENQLAELEKYREVDPTVMEEEYLSWEAHARLYTWHNDPSRLLEKLQYNRARMHRMTELEEYDKWSGNPRGWRCYSEGSSKFRRKDGKPVTEMDVEAINLNVRGQGHGVKVSEDGMYISHSWFVDSSD